MFYCASMTPVWLVGLNTIFLKVTFSLFWEKMGLGKEGEKVWSVNLVCSDTGMSDRPYFSDTMVPSIVGNFFRYYRYFDSKK